MADRFKYAEVRQKIIDAIRTDLIGPLSPEEVPSLVGGVPYCGSPFPKCEFPRLSAWTWPDFLTAVYQR